MSYVCRVFLLLVCYSVVTRIMKESITVRTKALKDGTRSIYLDMYVDGVRKYEFLKLYLIPEKTREDRQTNAETMKLVNAIKARKLVELQNGRFGFRTQTSDVGFFDLIELLIERHRQQGRDGTAQVWTNALKRLHDYERNNLIKVSAINSRWIEGFKTYLDKAQTRHGQPLGINTQASYYRVLRATINFAYKEDLIGTNPIKAVQAVRPTETERVFLTVDEVRLLANTPCKSEPLKRAFLFSCLTGLRRSDIDRLTWEQVQQGDFCRIVFKQKKTHGLEYLDIAPQAVSLMGERGEGRIFDLPCKEVANRILKRWAADAGIHKSYGFHAARHTFAVMLLNQGVDIYVVSKLLGHRELKTTQIYAKVLDKSKQAAVSNLPSIL